MLFGSTMLELAISLFFIYLLLSLICSTITEWLAGFLKLRSTTLQEGIRNLFNDPTGTVLAKKFYDHPLIKGMARKQGARSLPSYISAQTFVRVLLDITAPEPANADKKAVANTETEQPSDDLLTLATSAPQQDSNGPRTLLDLYRQLRNAATHSDKRPRGFGATMLMLFDEAGVDLTKIEQTAETLQELNTVRKKFRQFADDSADTANNVAHRLLMRQLNELEKQVATSEAEIKQGLASAQKNLEGYFDQTMERVSGWYKRHTQRFIIILALVVSLGLNVDTWAIATNLNANSELRSAIVRIAEQEVQTVDMSTEQPLEELLATRDELVGLGLPIGWQIETWPPFGMGWLPYLLLKLLGIALTTVAVSLGAPFWFDLLNKLVDLRMTGKKE